MDFHAATIGRMARQLRMYTIKPGELESFSREWGEHILPLRLQSGFRVLGPWVIDETNQFVWILEHDGNFELADSRYYELYVRETRRTLFETIQSLEPPVPHYAL